MTPKILRIAAFALILFLVGGLGFFCFRFNGERNRLVTDLERVENRNQLLDKKYKEEKAQVGRLQRETLTLNGQARQAKMDKEQCEAEAAHIRDEQANMEGRLKACSDGKAKLVERIDQLNASYDQLKKKLTDTTVKLKTEKAERAKLEDRNQALRSNLQQSESANQRYLTHNQKLSEIAKTLVARVEKDELGSSVLVKEPLIQWKRVELENLLQDYLDGIDKELIVE